MTPDAASTARRDRTRGGGALPRACSSKAYQRSYIIGRNRASVYWYQPGMPTLRGEFMLTIAKEPANRALLGRQPPDPARSAVRSAMRWLSSGHREVVR
jgi:hypothetical protein